MKRHLAVGILTALALAGFAGQRATLQPQAATAPGTDGSSAGPVTDQSRRTPSATPPLACRGGVLQDLDTTDGRWSEARALNAAGQVVGVSKAPDGTHRPDRDR